MAKVIFEAVYLRLSFKPKHLLVTVKKVFSVVLGFSHLRLRFEKGLRILPIELVAYQAVDFHVRLTRGFSARLTRHNDGNLLSGFECAPFWVG